MNADELLRVKELFLGASDVPVAERMAWLEARGAGEGPVRDRVLRQLARLDLSISNEKETERVLEAEWSMLNSPERIESLAKKYLDLGLPQPSQLVSGSESLEGAEIAGQAGLIPASAEMTKAGPFPAVIPRKPPHGVSPSNEQENSPE